MDWGKLQIFIAIVRGGSLERAARTLSVDATTIGRRLRALERDMQTTLFERSREGMVPTADGRQLLAIAEDMERAAAGLETRRNHGAPVTGVVRVSTTEGFGTRFVAPRIADFSTAYPGITLDLFANSGFLNPSRREADVAILLAQPRKGPLRTRRLTDYTLGLYAPAHVTDHSALPFVSYIPDFLYAPELDYLSEVEPNRAPHLRSSSINAQAHMIAGGAGIGVLPCFLADPDPALVRIRPEIALQRTFWLAVHQEIATIPRVRAFVDWIVAITTDAQPLLKVGASA
ncbi:MAG: LysR family transcriptional regulator [Sphingomonadales bacterium]